jgi:N-acetylglutamate synthase-like GNAT family acetyltransferase
MALNLSGSRMMFWRSIIKLGKDEQEKYRLRPATLSDIPLLDKLYGIYCKQSMVWRVRSEAEWQFEISHTEQKDISYHSFYLIETIDGETVGYFEAPPGKTLAFCVREIAVLPGYSLREVGEFLTRAIKGMADEVNKTRELPFDAFSFELGAEHPMYRALDRHLEKLWKPYAWFIRVPDLPGFIRHIAPVLEKRLVGSVMEGYSGTIKLNFYTSQMTLVFEKGHLVETGTYKPDRVESGDAVFPELTFLHMLFGHRSFSDLRFSFPDCYAENSRAEVLLDALFPVKSSNITPLY